MLPHDNDDDDDDYGGKGGNKTVALRIKTHKNIRVCMYEAFLEFKFSLQTPAATAINDGS